MHIHILGICGTFMGGVALLAKRAGHHVSGQDQHTYPPMSTQLESEGIELFEGYSPECMDPAPDLVVIGNALSRGNPAVEHLRNSGVEDISGPRWLLWKPATLPPRGRAALASRNHAGCFSNKNLIFSKIVKLLKTYLNWLFDTYLRSNSNVLLYFLSVMFTYVI